MNKLSIRDKKLLSSKKSEKVILKVNSLIELQKDIVENLLSVLTYTKDDDLRKFIAFSIIDNFKDDRIISTFEKLIKEDSLKKNNAILVYALGEYTNDASLLPFLVDLILNFDYHVAWNALNIIKSMDANIEESLIQKLSLKVNDYDSKESDKEELIHDLKVFLRKHNSLF